MTDFENEILKPMLNPPFSQKPKQHVLRGRFLAGSSNVRLREGKNGLGPFSSTQNDSL